ncbi:MAG: hypothetical protein JWM99_40, partial [Verrucomicrobiales bacterium]|nr:hypothetical protein [Verrucomicrobiales bacterium]
EDVGHVLQSGTQGEGGEIFVLDKGNPEKIVYLAKQIIELNGLIPDEDIEIEFIGLRPGEKLFEEFSHRGEHLGPTTHQKVMRFNCKPLPLKEVRSHFEKIKHRLQFAEANELKLLLKEAVPEYQPYLTE